MKLAETADVLARLNLAGIATTNVTTIDSALEAATVFLESKLRTPLDSSSVLDFFSYNPSIYAEFTPTTLYLSRKFVDGDVSLYVSSADNVPLLDVASGTALTLGVDYVQNTDKGNITLITEPPIGYMSIAAEYEAGFTEGGTIPDWLKEAAISAAILIHHTQGVIHSKKDAKDMTTPLAQAVYAHINEHIYTHYNGLFPDNTIVS